MILSGASACGTFRHRCCRGERSVMIAWALDDRNSLDGRGAHVSLVVWTDIADCKPEVIALESGSRAYLAQLRLRSSWLYSS